MSQKEYLHKDKNEILLLFIGILITIAYLILGILYPIYDYDIKEWLSIQPAPSRLVFFEPVLPHAILPGLIAGIFSNITQISLYTSHIITSCILTGIFFILLLIYSYRIAHNLAVSIIFTIGTAFTRVFVILSLSGENDLSGSFLLIILLYQIWMVSKNKPNNPLLVLNLKKYVNFGFLSGLLLFFHFQYLFLAFSLPIIYAKITLNTDQKPSSQKFRMILKNLSRIGIGFIGSILILWVLSIFLSGNYSPSEFIVINQNTFVNFTADPSLFFFASDLDVGTRLNDTIYGLFKSLYYEQFLFDQFLSVDVILLFIILTLLFWINPLVSYFRESDSEWTKFSQILFILEGVYLIFIFLFEPYSPERWAPEITLIAFHNCISFPKIYEKKNEIKSLSFKIKIILIGAFFFGAILSINLINLMIKLENLQILIFEYCIYGFFTICMILLVTVHPKRSRIPIPSNIEHIKNILFSWFIGFYIMTFLIAILTFIMNCSTQGIKGWCGFEIANDLFIPVIH